MISGLTRDMFQDTVKPVPTLAQVVELFDWLADMKDISHHYTRDGCYARTHVMCKKMMEKNYTALKAWAFHEENHLAAPLANGSLGEWYFHVAPALVARMPDGKTEKLVLDPALFGGPVTLEEWRKTIRADKEYTCVAPFGKPPFNRKHDYNSSTSTTPETDQKALTLLANYMLYFPPPEQRIVYASPHRAAHIEGETWVSATTRMKRVNETGPEQQEFDF